MRVKKHTWSILLVLFTAFLVGDIFLVLKRSDLLDQKNRGESELFRTKRTADEVRDLLSFTPPKRSDDFSLDESVSRVTQALQSAAVSPAMIVDIRIQGRTPIPKTNYIREDTSVTLHRITVRQLLSSLKSLESDHSKSICSAVDVRFRNGDGNGSAEENFWDLNATVTHLAELQETRVRSNR